MRKFVRVSLVVATAALAGGAAIAQQGPSRSVDDYLCVFAGECGEQDQGPEISREAPDTKGFRLVRRSPNAAAQAPAAAPRQRSASATNRAPAQNAGADQRMARSNVSANRAPRSARTQVAARADLRLNFELGSAVMTAQAREEARVFAQALLAPALADRRFRIEGHTDSVGGRASNLQLSQRRAEAVAEYLQSQGVARDRIEVRGLGYDRPLPGRSARASENRRVEAVLIS